LWQRWIYAREARCLAAYEKRITDRFDAGVVVSEPEAALLRTVTGRNAGVHAIPNGVDLDYFHPATGDGPSPSEKEFTLVCCGLMDYYPNVDGVLWFAQEVWPMLKDRIPTPRLTIVGANPAREIRRLGSHSGIEVTGRVPDIRPYVWRASVAIAPMRIARGIQNKVLEAMAMGKPVVATHQAFEGIDAVPGEDLMVADGTAGTFAEKIISLWQDPALAKTMGARARQTMVRNYAWERHLNALNNLLENTP
jgi:sugar transferase (PEP-CTERM/EpsH1 system associated)